MSRHSVEYVECDDCADCLPVEEAEYSDWSLEYGDNDLCNDCAENYSHCGSCEERYHYDDTVYCENADPDYSYCHSCSITAHVEAYDELRDDDPEAASEFWVAGECSECCIARPSAQDARRVTNTGVKLRLVA